MNAQGQKGGPDRFDVWLSRVVRTLAAFLGMALLGYEAVKGHNIEFGLLAVGIIGLPLGHAVEHFLLWITSLRPPPIQQHPSPPSEQDHI